MVDVPHHTAGPDQAISEFGSLIAEMTRVLAGLSTISQLKDAGLGIAEWATLSIVEQLGETNNKQLAIKLGVSRQRVHQLVAELTKAELLSVDVSSRDSRENVITLSNCGSAKLQAVNAELSSLIVSTLGSKVRALPKLKSHLKLLMKVVHAGKSAASSHVGPRNAKPHSEKYDAFAAANPVTLKHAG